MKVNRIKFCNIFYQKVIKIDTSLNLPMFKKIWRYITGKIFSSILYKRNWLLCLQTLYVVFFRTSGGTTHNISYTQPLHFLFHIGILNDMDNEYWVTVELFCILKLSLCCRVLRMGSVCFSILFVAIKK